MPAALAPEAAVYREWLAAWERLEPGDRDPLTHPAWVAAWTLHADRRARERRLLLFRDRTAGIVGAIPVFVARRGGALRLAHLGGIESGALSVPEAAIEPCLEALFRTDLGGGARPRSLHLHRIDAGSPLLRTSWLQASATIGHRSLIPYGDGWPGVAERLSKNFRGNLRKARNRLAARGVERIDVAGNPSELAAALPRFIAVDERSWKHDDGTVIAADAPYRGFLEDAVARLAPIGAVQIHLLSLGGVDIAGQLTLLIDGVLHVVKVSYDHEHADLSPGNLLLEATLRDYCMSVRPRCVSLVTGLDWHRNWRPEPAPTCAVWFLARDWRRLPARLFDVPPEENLKSVLAALHLMQPARTLRHRLAG